MAHQIFKTSKDKYAIFSSISDDIIGFDATKEEIIEFYKEEASKRAEEETKRIFEKLETNQKPYHQFTMSVEEILETIKLQHGNEIYLERKKELEMNDNY